MTNVRITHVGGPTALIEFDGWRLLTDPAFDAPGHKYPFGRGMSARKTTGPSIGVADLPPIDAVLLSHDQHPDNLDTTGRGVLASAGVVVTTRSCARRLRRTVHGLRPWGTTTLEGPGRPPIEITATPCRHGPPLSGRLSGEVTGFSLRWTGQRHGELWISGDTVLYRGVREIARRLDVGTALLHLGAARHPATGPARHSMTAADAVQLCGLLRPHTTVPVHYEGWSHFRQGRIAVAREFSHAPPEVRTSLTWLSPGAATQITV
ncbi:MBL fold metallo-hydrolase [Streptomyces sp. SID3212]|uniref:MBL fold metallo-hydrolase n=1 Tax=unclassified Streptomyces TaxID=2593676 RepID=UPI0013697C15|nr:MBL fold metallo-hydrolase [Streptomyces sp. SID3212]MYV54683.1 MBL fold metallo-hydrolase [Streptomyces sp. SID3212]